jgi:hypothetical protein
MPADPTLDEKIAALNRSLNRWAIHKDDMPILCAVVADLEARRPTPVPDDPKDAERLAALSRLVSEISDVALRGGIWHCVLALNSQRDAATRERDNYKQASLDCHAALGRCAEERDAAIRRAEALEAEVGRLTALVADVTTRANIEISRLRDLAVPPAADHTERAQAPVEPCDLVRAIEWHLTRCDDADDYRECNKVATTALTAAGRAGAEKMREHLANFVEEYLPAHFELGWLRKELAGAIRALPLPGEE